MRRSLYISALLIVLAFTTTARAAELAILTSGFTIRHESREEIGEMTRLHTTNGYVDVPTAQISSYEVEELPPPELVAAVAEPLRGTDLDELILAAAARYSLDPDLIRCLIRAESSFNPRAVSPKGAQGLMQLMPATAAELGVKNVFDPAENIDGGSRYLSMLLTQYGDDLVKALAAYNAGPERVKQYGGVPPFRETRQYVARIVKEFNQKKRAEAAAAKSTRSSTPGLMRAKAATSEPSPRDSATVGQ